MSGGTPPHPYTLRAAWWRWLFVVMLQVGMFAAVLALGAQDASHARGLARRLAGDVERASVRRSEEKLAELRAQCERGNVQRAWDVMNAQPGQAAATRALFPLLDCYATMYRAQGRAVLLAPTEGRRYMVIVAAGQTPVVDTQGHVRR